jgi:hypothetical protein
MFGAAEQDLWQKITVPASRTTSSTRGLRKKGMSKSRVAAISNSEGSSSQGGTSQQKKAAGRKGGKAAAKSS